MNEKIISANIYQKLITQYARRCVLECKDPIINNNKQDRCDHALVEFKIWWEKKKIKHAITIKLICAMTADT